MLKGSQFHYSEQIFQTTKGALKKIKQVKKKEPVMFRFLCSIVHIAKKHD